MYLNTSNIYNNAESVVELTDSTFVGNTMFVGSAGIVNRNLSNWNINAAGGAYSVLFSGSAKMCSTTINNCTFEANSVGVDAGTDVNNTYNAYGGGSSVLYIGVASNCVAGITGEGTFYVGNTVFADGGSTKFDMTTFANGGGASIYYSNNADNCTTDIDGRTSTAHQGANEWALMTWAKNSATSNVGGAFGGALSICFSGSASFCTANVRAVSLVNNTANGSSEYIVLGGAASVYFDGSASFCTVLFAQSNSVDNVAVASNSDAHGGAFSVFISGNATGFAVDLFESVFTSNLAGGGHGSQNAYGGAVDTYFQNPCSHCNVAVNASKFSGNVAFASQNNAYGGAVSIYFNSNATNCKIIMNDNVHSNNSASLTVLAGFDSQTSGGAVSIVFDENATGCSIWISNSNYSNNGAIANQLTSFIFLNSSAGLGGAFGVNFNSFVSNSSITFENTRFVDNLVQGSQSVFGGAVSIYYTAAATNCTFLMRSCDHLDNRAITLDTNNSPYISFGGAVSVLFNSLAAYSDTIVYGGTFSNNTINNFAGAYGGAFSIYFEELSSNCIINFTSGKYIGNTVHPSIYASQGGAVNVLYLDVVTNTNIYVLNGTFCNNTAESYPNSPSFGGAVAVSFTGSSVTNTTVHVDGGEFMHNIAKGNGQGGAVGIYLGSSSGNCSVNINDSIFSLNQAGFGAGFFIIITNGSYGDSINTTGLTTNLTNCEFSEQTASNAGGGLAIMLLADNSTGSSFSDSLLMMRNNSFSSNNASIGGAMALYLASVTEFTFAVENCSFEGNSATSGGAVAVLPPQSFKAQGTTYSFDNVVLAFSRVVFENNNASQGGAVFVSTDNVLVNMLALNMSQINCSGNTAKLDGGGMYVSTGSVLNYYIFNNFSALFTDSSFSNNKANTGAALYAFGNSQVNMMRSNFSNNQAKNSAGDVHFAGTSQIPFKSVAAFILCTFTSPALTSTTITPVLVTNVAQSLANGSQVVCTGGEIENSAPVWINSSVEYLETSCSNNKQICSLNVLLHPNPQQLWNVQCTPCHVSTYQLAACAGQKCLPCPLEGARCDGGTAISAKEG